MSAPLATPLLLPSEYNASSMNAPVSNTAVLLAACVRVSEFLQRMFQRRFDERIETRRYTCILERDGGDLLDPFTLLLDDDLKVCLQLAQRVQIGGTINDGFQVSSTVYKLLTGNPRVGTPVTTYSIVRINQYSGSFFYTGGVDPYENIWLNGLWGYGGQWLPLAGTLAATITDTASSLTVATGTIEAGMLLKLDTEYVYADGITVGAPNDTVSIVRAMNGSTAAAHTSGITLYRWQALETVRDLAARLIQWRMEQRKAPMAGSVTVGDFTFPVTTDGLPKDLYLIMRDTYLQRSALPRGV